MDDTNTKTLGPFPFTGPAKGAKRPNRKAHGGVCYVDVRENGKRRERNVNGAHSEIGTWQ